MRAGRMRHLVTLYSVAKATTPGGTETETEVDDVWAAIEPASGREFFLGGTALSEVTGEVVMRYRSDVTKSMRVGLGIRRWEILAVVDPDERHRELQLAVKELV